MRIERFVPGPLINHYRRIRSSLKNTRFGKDNVDIFNRIYRTGAWSSDGNSEIYSGPGSYESSVNTYIEFVRQFITEHKVSSVVEVGCGDFSVANHYANMVESYLGADVSSVVVLENTRQFSNNTIRFVHADASKIDLPPADLCIIRQVLQHLDNDAIAAVLERTKMHRFVLVTEHLPNPTHLKRPNVNKRTGPDTRLHFASGVYVDLPPFDCEAETVLVLPVTAIQEHPGEIMRTSLLRNERR